VDPRLLTRSAPLLRYSRRTPPRRAHLDTSDHLNRVPEALLTDAWLGGMIVFEFARAAQIALAMAIEVYGVGKHVRPRLLDPQDNHMRRQVVALGDLDQARGQGIVSGERHAGVDKSAAGDFFSGGGRGPRGRGAPPSQATC
jgi:hypothetical protein